MLSASNLLLFEERREESLSEICLVEESLTVIDEWVPCIVLCMLRTYTDSVQVS